MAHVHPQHVLQYYRSKLDEVDKDDVENFRQLPLHDQLELLYLCLTKTNEWLQIIAGDLGKKDFALTKEMAIAAGGEI